MNDEVLESQKHGENSRKDSETLKKHYVAGTPHVLLKPIANIDEPACHSSSFDSSADDTREPGYHVMEIVESSRTKA
ncbi:unnamed protein product [Dovyalis caffra]|uniref:Uncharacterized protein n=1 Tax=Dovyalis caffra TaxID=77055 RepID=A0AAV1RGP4_9ROSI|nr:unnamed protein product [Dovyalis caffra]